MKDYDRANGKSHINSFYEAMSWAGLKGTVAWNELSPSQQTVYRNLYLVEDTKGGCE